MEKGKERKSKRPYSPPGNQRDGRGSAGKAWPRAVPQGRIFRSQRWRSYRERARRQGYSWSHTYLSHLYSGSSNTSTLQNPPEDQRSQHVPSGFSSCPGAGSAKKTATAIRPCGGRHHTAGCPAGSTSFKPPNNHMRRAQFRSLFYKLRLRAIMKVSQGW